MLGNLVKADIQKIQRLSEGHVFFVEEVSTDDGVDGPVCVKLPIVHF